MLVLSLSALALFVLIVALLPWPIVQMEETAATGRKDGKPRNLRLEEQQALSAGVSGVTASPTAANAEIATTWQVVNEADVLDPPPFPTQWSKEGRILVQTSDAMTMADAWRTGDQISIPIPQLGEVYRPVIEEVDEGLGARALSGRVIDNDGGAWRYVITVGATNLFAYISTPAGSFELASQDGYGWLVPSASMVAGQDFSKPDYVLPDDRSAPP